MVRVTNYTTFLLVLIVLILVIGVGIAAYYVLDLEWFSNPIVIYKEEKTSEEIKPTETIGQIKYDLTKRAYNILLTAEEFRVIVYKDGTVGITMVENMEYRNIEKYLELINTELKPDISNIVRVYEVTLSNGGEAKNYILLLDEDGNLYKLVLKQLIDNGKYVFEKIEGLANIIDVRQITNDGLTENVMGSNAMAIDNENNEILLTNYLINEN